MKIKSLKFPNKLHLEWATEIIQMNNEWLVVIAYPWTLVTHHTRNIQFVLDHTSLWIFSDVNNYNVMIDFNMEGDFQKIYCNIALPADWSQNWEVSWIDLDLDIIVKNWEKAKLIDKDEFDENIKNGIYPAEIANLATNTANELMLITDSGNFPFIKSSLTECLATIQRIVSEKK